MEILGDGNCLLGALTHQVYGKNVAQQEHKHFTMYISREVALDEIYRNSVACKRLRPKSNPMEGVNRILVLLNHFK